MTRLPLFLICAAAAGLGAGAAHAHIVFAQTQAPGGSNYMGALHVGHGCAGSPTVALSVTLPTEIIAAKPQPKPGWTLQIDHEPLADPVKGEGGKPVTQRVSRITWRGGPLPDDEFDDFGLTFKLPAGEGPIYFPAVQTCASGQTAWVEIPAPGRPWTSTPHPAPVIDRTTPMGPMPGMDMSGH